MFVAERYTAEGGTLTLRHWRGGWWQWRTTHWAEVEHRAVRARRLRVHRARRLPEGRGRPECRGRQTATRSPTCWRRWPRSATCPRRRPARLDRRRRTTARSSPAPTGCSTSARASCSTHNPLFFNQTAVPFDYDPDAPEPERWLAFLETCGRETTTRSPRSGVVRLRDLRAPRPAQDPAAGRPDPRRQGRDRPDARRAGRPRERRRPDAVQPRRRLRAGAADRQAAGGDLRRPPRRPRQPASSSSGCCRSPARTRSRSTASTATSGPASCRAGSW